MSTRPVQLLQGLAGNVRPLSLARERVLPVLPALADLVPGGLRRGTTVVVTTSTVTTSTVTTSTTGIPQGATSLALSLAAAASLTGSWSAVVGVPDLGLTAAAELGLVLSRLALVPSPPPAQWVTVVSALLDTVDLVIARPPAHLRAGDARRLSTRARERDSVLVPLLTLPSHHGRGRPWSDGADIRLAVTGGKWEGPGAGDGRLVGRRLEVTGGGRGAAAQTRQTILWLPAPTGSGDGLAYAGADADQIPDATSQPAGAETHRGMTAVAARTLVVWCPDWPLVAAGIPPSVPAAAFHANRVVACTAAARAEGVGRGLRRREAQARCPGLRVEQHDPLRDTRAFEPIAAVIETFVPRLEITRPGACALPTRGPSRYFGGDDALARLIREAVDAVLARLPGWGADIACRAGIADGPFAASLAARRALVVPPGDTAGFLAPLPVTLLDEPELTDLLLRLGISTLGAFAALPADDVIGRFGPTGAAAHRRAQGLDDRDLTCREPPPDLAVQVVLDPPADRVDTAAFAAKAIADGLCRSLAEGGLVCTCIRIETETEHGEQFGRTWRHHRAFTPTTVAERVRWQLEGWLAERTRCGCPPDPPGGPLGLPDLPGGPPGPPGPPGPHGLPGPPCPGGAACPNPVGGTSGGLTLLRVVPEQVDRDGGRQGGFWGGITEADDRAARGLARIQGILGPEAVVTAVLGGGRGPGEQIRLVSWGEPREPARPGPPLPPDISRSSQSPAPRPNPRPAPTAARPNAPTTAPTTAPTKGRPKGRPNTRATNAKAGTRVRTSGRSPSATETPAWPGRIPSPAPAVVHVTPPPAELVDRSGDVLRVTSRSLLSGAPVSLSVAGGPWERVTAWAGPWTADERWWDPAAHRRRARLQIVTDAGAAHLLALEGGRWRVEATYD